MQNDGKMPVIVKGMKRIKHPIKYTHVKPAFPTQRKRFTEVLNKWTCWCNEYKTDQTWLLGSVS